MSADLPIARLCRLLGVETNYVDNAGIRRESPRTTLIALLAALGYAAATDADIAESSARLRRQPVERPLEPVTVHRNDHGPPTLLLTQPGSPDGSFFRWRLATEQGAEISGEMRFSDLPLAERIEIDGGVFEQRRLVLPADLPLGYHRARLEFGGAESQSAVMVVPPRAYEPPAFEHGAGVWGLAIQLYGLRSARNWGIGDLTDLNLFLRDAATAGAAAVGLNPLHALFPDDAGAASPYSPSSRLFSNPIYLDVERIAEFGDCAEAQALTASAAWRAAMQRLRDSELVDYVEVTERKLSVLELLYRQFRAASLTANDARAGQFREFQMRAGAALRQFAIFHVLRESIAKDGGAWRFWREWPAPYRDPASPAVAAFAAKNTERVEFLEYLQWQFDGQFAECAAVVRQRNMPIGLYCDLAVGNDANGSEAWANQTAIASGWSIGAPPDDYNANGQSWGLPPFNPLALRTFEYRPLIDTYRANMRHAGALRIDHILGYRRLFWVPADGTPADGVFVHYPFDDMIGLLALESHRQRCLIVGEDLGTLPPGLRESLAESSILSYRLLRFEREWDGSYRAPESYPRSALATAGTHDLPTFPGFWEAADILLRARLGLYASDEDVSRDLAQRSIDRDKLTAALRHAGLPLPADGADRTPPTEAAYRFLARTPSRLLMVLLEDVLGIREQINVPGTVDSYPNWRRRVSPAIEHIFDRPEVLALLGALRAERPPAAPRAER